MAASLRGRNRRVRTAYPAINAPPTPIAPRIQPPPSGDGFPVVIADQTGGHIFYPAAQSWNFRVADQILAVSMVRLPVNHVPGVVKCRACFKNRSEFEIHMMVGPELIEKL